MAKTTKKDSAVTRARILIVAEKLFSEKGFDATRVDEIAEKAEVNKALIYYYFKSKDAILEALFSSAIRDIIVMIEYIYEDFELDEDEIRRMFDCFVDLVFQKKKIIKIMYMESLKKSAKQPYLFKIADYIMGTEVETMLKLFKDKGYDLETTFNKKQMMVTEFFTGFIPVINYVIFSEEWCKSFDMNMDELKKWFYFSFKMTHVAYHKAMLQ
ncbi:MAG: TetR/AcrR family transcriptional regulator [Chitinispirillaceae bacterium]|nr:TetR/AcrR family transcriptional regulator [Chitinispirillaceae bacterium]